jgi:hypothetical protein
VVKVRSRKLRAALVAAPPVAIGALLVVALAAGGPAPARHRLPPAMPVRPQTAPPVSFAKATRPALTAAGWRRRATAICNAVNVPSISTSSMQAAAPGFEAISYALARLADQLGQLPSPARLSAEAASMLALLRQESQIAGEASAAAATGDTGGLQSEAEQLAGLEPRDASVWPQLGMRPCR